MEVVRRPKDGVARVVHVVPKSVRLPGGGDELHGPLRSRRAGRHNAAELRLDEVDRGEDLPSDAEPLLGLLVVTEEEVCGRRGLSSEGWGMTRRRDQRDEL